MIDAQVFAYWTGVIADRMGRTLSRPTLAEYRRSLSERLSTTEFIAAARLVFEQETFWPSPQVFVDKVKPAITPNVAASQAFDRVDSLVRQHGLKYLPGEEIDALDEPTKAGIKAIGGWRALSDAAESEWPHLRRVFEGAYRHVAGESERSEKATRAIAWAAEAEKKLIHGAAGAELQRLVAGVAEARDARRVVGAEP